MTSYDTSYETQVHSTAVERPRRLSWSGIVGGTALGWGIFSLLSLIGAAIGFAKFDPWSAQPANGLGAGSGIFGVIALIVSSFLALVAALFGAISAASRTSGRSLADEFRFGRRHGNGGAATRSTESVSSGRADDELRPRM